MILKKFHFPIFTLLLIVVVLLFSCKKEEDSITTSKIKEEFYKLYDKAELLYKQEDYSKAFYYYTKAKLIGETLNDHNKIIYSLMQMAIIQQAQSDFLGSETSATEAIKYFQKDTHIEYKINIYLTLGTNYMNLYDFDEALKYYFLALSITKDAVSKIIIKNNTAVVYSKKKEFKKAIAILSTALKQTEVLTTPETHALILCNLGNVYRQTGHPSSLKYLKQSLEIRKKINNDFSTIASYFHLAEYYEPINSALAKDYAIVAYEKATKINSAEDRLETLGQILKNSNGNELKKYSLIHLRLNDSLKKAKQIAKNQFAKIKYDASKAKEENTALKLQEERTHTKNVLLYITLVSLLVLSLLIYFLIRSKHKREKLLTSYTTETRIAKKLHDELANDVFQVMTYADTQDLSTEKNKETLVQTLDTIYSRTRNISKENSSIDTGPNFVPYLKEVISSYSSTSISVLVNGLDPSLLMTLDNSKKIVLYRTINELLVNMKKHSQCNLVVISFKKTKKYLEIEYSDNGVGIASDALILKNGLQNVENRILDINGTLTFDNASKKGFRVKVCIPL
jgi:signal transduction histidine kinase